ncbi:hypothetical protein KSS87_010916, partial [Heliosperma pusillum]
HPHQPHTELQSDRNKVYLRVQSDNKVTLVPERLVS